MQRQESKKRIVALVVFLLRWLYSMYSSGCCGVTLCYLSTRPNTEHPAGEHNIPFWLVKSENMYYYGCVERSIDCFIQKKKLGPTCNSCPGKERTSSTQVASVGQQRTMEVGLLDEHRKTQIFPCWKIALVPSLSSSLSLSLPFGSQVFQIFSNGSLP